MSKAIKYLALIILAVFLFSGTACVANSITPRLAGEYRNLVEASAPGHYYDLKPLSENKKVGYYEKGKLFMINGTPTHGKVTEKGKWQEEVGGIHFSYTDENGNEVNYNTIFIYNDGYMPFNLPWVFGVTDDDQTTSMYYQYRYYE